MGDCDENMVAADSVGERGHRVHPPLGTRCADSHPGHHFLDSRLHLRVGGKSESDESVIAGICGPLPLRSVIGAFPHQPFARELEPACLPMRVLPRAWSAHGCRSGGRSRIRRARPRAAASIPLRYADGRLSALPGMRGLCGRPLRRGRRWLWDLERARAQAHPGRSIGPGTLASTRGDPRG